VRSTERLRPGLREKRLSKQPEGRAR
jgi:hypothetical protein